MPEQETSQAVKLKCETEIGDHMVAKEPLSYRLANGLPLLCGRPAAWYSMSGQLTSVKAKLCELHVKMFEARGLHVRICAAPEE